MLHVVRKDLKPVRYHNYSSDDDDGDGEDEDDDFLGIEDLDETSKATTVDTDDGDGHADDSEGMLGGEATGKEVTKNEEVDSGGMLGADASSDDEVDQNGNDHHLASDDSDGDMDDDAMLMKDSAIADILKQRLSSGKDSALSQLLIFKSRVLSLLEIFLQKHPGIVASSNLISFALSNEYL